MRSSEAVTLDIGDYDADSGRLTVRQGKGRKDRTTYPSDHGAASEISAWLELRGLEDDLLVCSSIGWAT